jgi:hypothetical protein
MLCFQLNAEYLSDCLLKKFLRLRLSLIEKLWIEVVAQRSSYAHLEPQQRCFRLAAVFAGGYYDEAGGIEK